MHSLGGRRPRLTLPDATSPLGLWLRFAVASLVTTSISLVVIRPAWEDLGLLALLLAATGAAVVVGTPRLARWPRVAALAPPVLSFVALGLTGPLTDRLAPAISGLFTLLFVYVGVTQKRGTATWLLPLAAGCWLLANMPVDRATVARLPVAIGIWGIIGELLASITSRNAADQAVLEQRAAYDALTGLHNRHDLDERLADLGPGDAVVFIDLDHFKTVNDTFGHSVGDRVLADLGRVVLAVLRARDVAVRYGGEEVLLLLPRAGHAGADRCLERMRVGWSASHPELTFSAGVGVIGPAEEARDAMLRADEALYRAKAEGRNRTVHGDVIPDADRSAITA